jgi:tetratricopeptide (TPR) repeat protein
MSSSAPVSEPSLIGAELDRIRALLRQQKFAEAEAGGLRFLEGFPDHRDARLWVAVAQRMQNRIPEALRTLELLERSHARFSRLHEERGLCFVVLRDGPRATESLLRAVHINNALPVSWRTLEGLYRMAGEKDNAAMAAAHVATLAKLPPEVVIATAMFMDGDLEAAELLIRPFLLKQGNDVEAMRLLARIGIARKVYEDAEILLAAMLELAPGYRTARREYAEALLGLHKYAEARAQLERLLKEDPADRDSRTLYATTLAGLGEHARAIAIYQELLRGSAEDAGLHLSIAHAQKTIGQRQPAIDSYRKAAALRPGFGDAYWSLANLKTYRFSSEELARMRAAEALPGLAPADRYHLCFALGKALEDISEYQESWHYYQLGNALKRAESKYRPEILETNTRQQIEVCTSAFFAARSGWGAHEADPIFIVGLPRSGSTLVEQILASHSRVEGTQELPNIQQFVTALRGRDPDLDNPRYPKVLAELSAESFLKLGQKYFEETSIFRTGKPFFIDKMPNNFRHLGLIHLILPNARIIDARREPMACCFSNLKQLFAQGQEFSYSVEDIARYYRTYLQLMRHWNTVLPGRVLRMQHEDVVNDLEGSVRRLLDFCELEFEPACVEFYKTERSVRTASSEQVRQPLFREGLDQWRHFEPWLQSLKDALGDALTQYRYD